MSSRPPTLAFAATPTASPATAPDLARSRPARLTRECLPHHGPDAGSIIAALDLTSRARSAPASRSRAR